MADKNKPIAYGMDPEHLVNDIFVVKFNLNEIKERLEILDSSLDRKAFRPWMLRSQRPIFERTLEIRNENRTALEPFTNSTEYLCNRLNVDENGILLLIKKHPPLRRVQVYKLKEILDFLFSRGFIPLQVCASPRVLCHSFTTLEKRLKILHNIGYHPRNLHILCKTQKKFSEFVEKHSSDRYGIKTNQ